MRKRIKDFFSSHPKIKKSIGFILVVGGFIGIVTPFTPWGFLFFVGLEMFGIRLLWWNKIKEWFLKMTRSE